MGRGETLKQPQRLFGLHTTQAWVTNRVPFTCLQDLTERLIRAGYIYADDTTAAEITVVRASPPGAVSITLLHATSLCEALVCWLLQSHAMLGH